MRRLSTPSRRRLAAGLDILDVDVEHVVALLHVDLGAGQARRRRDKAHCYNNCKLGGRFFCLLSYYFFIWKSATCVMPSLNVSVKT